MINNMHTLYKNCFFQYGWEAAQMANHYVSFINISIGNVKACTLHTAYIYLVADKWTNIGMSRKEHDQNDKFTFQKKNETNAAWSIDMVWLSICIDVHVLSILMTDIISIHILRIQLSCSLKWIIWYCSLIVAILSIQIISKALYFTYWIGIIDWRDRFYVHVFDALDN